MLIFQHKLRLHFFELRNKKKCVYKTLRPVIFTPCKNKTYNEEWTDIWTNHSYRVSTLIKKKEKLNQNSFIWLIIYE